jgi:hypothetical protein
VEHTFRKPLFGSALTDSENIPFSHFSFERKDSSFKIVKKVTWYNFFFYNRQKNDIYASLLSPKMSFLIVKNICQKNTVIN